jgi:hypothetical protein
MKNIIIRLLTFFKNNIKSNIVHYLMLAAITILLGMQIIQLSLIGAIFADNNITEQNVLEHIQKYNENRIQDKKDIDILFQSLDNKTKTNMSDLEIKLNTKINLVDSAIEPEKKRRILIVKIRTAILENTTSKNNVIELNKIAGAVIDCSSEYGLSIPQILAQIRVESDFNINANSKAGAKGLMQLMPGTLKYVGLNLGKNLNSWSVRDNIQAGSFYMAEQMHEFVDYKTALYAYNWGPDNVKRYNAGEVSVMPLETQNYAPQVEKWAELFANYGLE